MRYSNTFNCIVAYLATPVVLFLLYCIFYLLGLSVFYVFGLFPMLASFPIQKFFFVPVVGFAAALVPCVAIGTPIVFIYDLKDAYEKDLKK